MGREKKWKGHDFQGGFLALPHAVSHSIAYRNLSAIAVKLLIDIGSQYKGNNNGDLTAAWKIMQPRGWKSQDTLNRAKKELLDAGFIAETRKGKLPNTCSLYGLTWLDLNPSEKHDYKPYAFPKGAWTKPPTLKPVKKSLPLLP